MKRFFWFVAMLLGSFGAVHQQQVQAQSSTVYVAPPTASPAGSDSTGLGTIQRPYASLLRATYKVNGVKRAPGTTIFMRGGVYFPTVTQRIAEAEINGNSSVPITIESYTGERAILDGTQLAANQSVISVTSSYIKIRNIEVRNSRDFGIELGGFNNQVLDCSLHDGYRSGLRAYNSGHIVTGCYVWYNCQVNRARNLPGGWPGALEGYQCSNVRFERNTVFENWGEGILFQISNGCKVINNLSRDNFSVNIYSDSNTNHLIDSNRVYSRGNSLFFRGSNPATGIGTANEKVSPLSSGITISNNIVSDARVAYSHGNFGSGGGQLKNSRIFGNTFQRAVLNGSDRGIVEIQAGDHTGSSFDNNKLGRGGTGFSSTVNINSSVIVFANKGNTFFTNPTTAPR